MSESAVHRDGHRSALCSLVVRSGIVSLASIALSRGAARAVLAAASPHRRVRIAFACSCRRICVRTCSHGDGRRLVRLKKLRQLHGGAEERGERESGAEAEAEERGAQRGGKGDELRREQRGQRDVSAGRQAHSTAAPQQSDLWRRRPLTLRLMPSLKTDRLQLAASKLGNENHLGLWSKMIT